MDIRRHRRFHTRLVRVLSFSGIIWLLNSCSYFLLQDIFIPMNFVAADSTTITDSSYTVDGRTWIWQDQGVKIEVEQITDPMLNALFPEISGKGEFSTNPFTYGNWVDMEKGYTPAKFTVFNIRIFNYTQPKVELDPRKVELQLDNSAVLRSYGLDLYDDPPNMERYLVAHQGSSGNERRRFKEKIGKAKQTMLVKDPVYKGKTAEGLIVFDPLPPEVKDLKVVIHDLILQFDANDWPSDIRKLTYAFKRHGNVEATALEMAAHLNADSTNIDDKTGLSPNPDVTSVMSTLIHDLESRNTRSYNELLKLVRSDIRFANAILDVEVTVTGSVIVHGILTSTGDQDLDARLMRAVEELSFAPIQIPYQLPDGQRTMSTVPIRFQLDFGLAPLLPRVRIFERRADILPAIGSKGNVALPAKGE